jgi:hypothetical protein
MVTKGVNVDFCVAVNVGMAVSTIEGTIDGNFVATGDKFRALFAWQLVKRNGMRVKNRAMCLYGFILFGELECA